MICRDAEALSSAYLDRELDAASSRETEAHLAECPACAARAERNDALRTAMQSARLRYAPPPDLAPRVRAAIRREGRPRWALAPRVWRRAALVATAASAAGLLWLASVNVAGPGGREQVVQELVEGHVRSLMVDHLVDVASTDQHTVRPWFNGKIDVAPPVADYASSGFPLVGGRIDYIGGRPVAALVYRRQQHVINVFVWPGGGDAAPRELSAQGYHLLHWSVGGLEYWAVSDVNAHELRTLVDLIRQS